MRPFILFVLATSLCAQDATVHIYRPRMVLGMAAHLPVYCDGADVAHMQNGRIFTMHVPAGKHHFESDSKRGGVDAELVQGEEYFFRIDIVVDGGFGAGHLEVNQVGPYRAKKEVEKLKPMDRKWNRETACGTDVPR
jgi:hypothetical protein